MKRIKIYLRSINRDGKKHLSLFDTNRNGDFDNLITDAPKGSKIIWTTDRKSGIKNITRISSKSGERNIFKKDPTKRFLCAGMKMKIPKDASGEEAYSIDYVLCDGTKAIIDPVIRIRPPD